MWFQKVCVTYYTAIFIGPDTIPFFRNILHSNKLKFTLLSLEVYLSVFVVIVVLFCLFALLLFFFLFFFSILDYQKLLAFSPALPTRKSSVPDLLTNYLRGIIYLAVNISIIHDLINIEGYPDDCPIALKIFNVRNGILTWTQL